MTYFLIRKQYNQIYSLLPIIAILVDASFARRKINNTCLFGKFHILSTDRGAAWGWILRFFLLGHNPQSRNRFNLASKISHVTEGTREWKLLQNRGNGVDWNYLLKPRGKILGFFRL